MDECWMFYLFWRSVCERTCWKCIPSSEGERNNRKSQSLFSLHWITSSIECVNNRNEVVPCKLDQLIGWCWHRASPVHTDWPSCKVYPERIHSKIRGIKRCQHPVVSDSLEDRSISHEYVLWPIDSNHDESAFDVCLGPLLNDHRRSQTAKQRRFSRYEMWLWLVPRQERNGEEMAFSEIARSSEESSLHWGIDPAGVVRFAFQRYVHWRQPNGGSQLQYGHFHCVRHHPTEFDERERDREKNSAYIKIVGVSYSK